MANKKKVLFINFGGLGDEILFLPTIQAVKKQYPDTEITLAMEERSKGILDLTNCIDKAYFADIKAIRFKPTPFERLNKILHFLYKINELTKLLFKIWGENYSLAISSGGNKLISVFLFCTLIPKRIGYNTGKLSEKILTRAVNLNKNQYAVNMYHDLVKPLINATPKLPELSIQRKPTIQNSVLIHPGVSKLSIQKGIIKTIQPSQWAEIIEKLFDKGKKIFLAGGPDDKECIETIIKSVPNEKFENLYLPYYCYVWNKIYKRSIVKEIYKDLFDFSKHQVG